MIRVKALVMILFYYILPTSWYLRAHGYNPDEIGQRMEKAAKNILKSKD